MPRLVQRRAALVKTRARAEKHVSGVVQELLSDLEKQLIAHYSGQIEKAMDDLIKDWDAEFQKALPPKPPVPVPQPVNQLQDWGGWSDWISSFDDALSLALIDGAGWIGNTETSFWRARGAAGVVYDPADVVAKYQDRIGRKITDIADETREAVQGDVSDWYANKGSLSDLSDTLTQYFTKSRADMIAATEMNNVASEVALDLMDQMGLTSWVWDSFEDWAVCDECDANHGQTFMRDDDMPPAHPNCRCTVSLEEAWQDKQAEEQVAGVEEPVDKLLKGYNPEEIRDDHGRWTSEGGDDVISPEERTKNRVQAVDPEELVSLESMHASDYDRGKLKQGVVDDISAGGNIEPQAVQDVLDGWASSSTGGWGLNIQEAASKEFDTPLSKYLQDRVNGDRYQAIAPMTGNQDTNQSILRAMYDATQKDLADAGYSPDDRVFLQRGVSMDPTDAVKGLQSGDVIRCESNPLESWTVSNNVAFDFGQAGPTTYGAVISTYVRVGDILSTPYTGLGCLREGEVVVLGKPRYASIVGIAGPDPDADIAAGNP